MKGPAFRVTRDFYFYVSLFQCFSKNFFRRNSRAIIIQTEWRVIFKKLRFNGWELLILKDLCLE